MNTKINHFTFMVTKQLIVELSEHLLSFGWFGWCLEIKTQKLMT